MTILTDNKIIIKAPGGPTQYCNYLQALTAAMRCTDLHEDHRHFIGELLSHLLPNEFMINENHHTPTNNHHSNAANQAAVH